MKNQKKLKKTHKTQKTQVGWFFSEKAGFFSNPAADIFILSCFNAAAARNSVSSMPSPKENTNI